MGFNAMQPGKVKRGDVLFLLFAAAVLGAAFAAVFLFVHW
jgi:hypothetical protein